MREFAQGWLIVLLIAVGTFLVNMFWIWLDVHTDRKKRR